MQSGPTGRQTWRHRQANKQELLITQTDRDSRQAYQQKCTDSHTEKHITQKEEKVDRQTEEETDKHADRKTVRQTSKHIQAGRQITRWRETDRQTNFICLTFLCTLTKRMEKPTELYCVKRIDVTRQQRSYRLEPQLQRDCLENYRKQTERNVDITYRKNSQTDRRTCKQGHVNTPTTRAKS